MAKRARGTTRPGQRPPIQRSARPAASQPAAVAAPLAPADPGSALVAGSEAGVIPAQPAGMTAVDGGRPVPADSAPAGRRSAASAATTGRLAAEAAEEYRYVARDVRRIALIGGSMFAILIILFILLEVIGLGH
jgi:hypothetical protein